MKKQWRAELRAIKKQKCQVDKVCLQEMHRLARELRKLHRANIRANNTAVRATRKLDRRAAIIQGRLS